MSLIKKFQQTLKKKRQQKKEQLRQKNDQLKALGKEPTKGWGPLLHHHPTNSNSIDAKATFAENQKRLANKNKKR